MQMELLLKRMKLLYIFFGFNKNYEIEGNYVTWELLKLNNAKFDIRKDYTSLIKEIVIKCETIEDFKHGINFLMFYFNHCNINIQSYEQSQIINIDNITIFITYDWDRNLILLGNDIIRFSNGSFNQIPPLLLKILIKFDNFILNTHITISKEYINILFERMGIWNHIEKLPFIIVNVVANEDKLADCLMYKCPICKEYIGEIVNEIICLMPYCCNRKFHYQCLNSHCYSNLKDGKIDCFKCQSNGIYKLDG
jgi:hypothetical protein